MRWEIPGEISLNVRFDICSVQVRDIYKLLIEMCAKVYHLLWRLLCLWWPWILRVRLVVYTLLSLDARFPAADGRRKIWEPFPTVACVLCSLKKLWTREKRKQMYLQTHERNPLRKSTILVYPLSSHHQLLSQWLPRNLALVNIFSLNYNSTKWLLKLAMTFDWKSLQRELLDWREPFSLCLYVTLGT